MWGDKKKFMMPIYKFDKFLSIGKDDFNEIFGQLESMYIFKFYIMIASFVLALVFMIGGLIICMVLNEKIIKNTKQNSIKKRVADLRTKKYDKIIQRNMEKIEECKSYTFHSVSLSGERFASS